MKTIRQIGNYIPENVSDALTLEEQRINNDYAELAACSGIELNGCFLLNDDNTVMWISY